MLHTDSVQAPTPPRGGGLRILATRFRGRFLKKSAYDVWMPNLGPSEVLLRKFQSGQITWPKFQQMYEREMLGRSGPPDRDNRVIKNHGQKFTLRLIARLATEQDVTLLCHCAREEMHCHRHLLARLIAKSAR